MKKIFAKELAALAVLAIAFTGCNTAFDGTNANFSEKESAYTDRSGAALAADSNAGSVTHTGSINVTNKKNVITVTVTSFSKLDTATEKDAILFQQLTNNTTNANYYPIRGTALPKTLIKVNENTTSTTFTYEVDGTGVTASRVALFVDAAKLKTKGGSYALNLDTNTKRGEESDCYVDYLTVSSASALTAITGTEDFRPTYGPTTGTWSVTPLQDASSKYTGVARLSITANNKKNTIVAGSADDWENGLASGFDVTLQYREPGKREYAEKKLSFTYHDAASTVATDPYNAHTYTADFGPLAIGTEYRVVMVTPAGLTAPAWYKDAYGHAGIVYGAASGVGKRDEVTTGTYKLHSSVPSYIVVNASAAQSGSDITSSYNPTEYDKTAIYNAQKTFFQTVTRTDNWIEVKTATGIELDPAAAKDFIVVDANNKKIDADVDVITYSYNNSNTDSGKVEYVKITVKDVRYRNSTNGLTVLVGSGTKIKENKTYPAQLTFGQWKDIVDDDASGYVKIN